MTRQEILRKARNIFFKDLPVFLDGLTPLQLERLELDLYRCGYDHGCTVTRMVQDAGRRNCGEEYFSQGD